MIFKTMVQNSIEDTKKLIRQNLEKRLFNPTNLAITVLIWERLKGLEDKLESGSFDGKEVETTFEILKVFYETASNNKPESDKRLEDMEVTIADDYYIFNKARALLKKYILEDKRMQALEVAWLASEDDNEDKINSIYQKEFEK